MLAHFRLPGPSLTMVSALLFCACNSDRQASAAEATESSESSEGNGLGVDASSTSNDDDSSSTSADGSGGSSDGGTDDASSNSDSADGNDTHAENADSEPGDSTGSGESGETETSGAETGESDGQQGDGTATCNGKILACGDGVDNDGDGLVDGQDPECTGACDDDESSFATGLPGDNVDCKQDCFFDGNSGHGDDKCIWDIRCDPANPGAAMGCEYEGGRRCEGLEAPSQACLDFCLGSVPNGCDCFGCCEVWLPDGEKRTVFLGSGGDCSLDNLDACEECTINHDCENPCEPELCEECIGDTPVPIDCEDEETECEEKHPCENQADCPDGFYCTQGCCYPNSVP